MNVFCDESLLSQLERAEPTLIWSSGGSSVTRFDQSRGSCNFLSFGTLFVYSFWFEFPERNAKNLQDFLEAFLRELAPLRCWKINLRSMLQARRSARTEWLSYSGGLSAIQIVLQFIAGLNGMRAFNLWVWWLTLICNPHCMLGLPFLWMKDEFFPGPVTVMETSSWQSLKPLISET